MSVGSLHVTAAWRIATVVFLAAVATCGESTGPGLAGVTIVSGANVTDTISFLLAEPLVVQVRNANGRWANGVPVEFKAYRVGADTNAFPPVLMGRDRFPFSRQVEDTADGSGRASVVLSLGAPIGDGRIVVSVPSLGVSVEAFYTSRPGAPVALVIAPRDTPVFVNGAYTFRVKSVDRLGDSVASNATFSTTSGNIQLSASGTVQGTVVGRARIGVTMGALNDSAFASVVPTGSVAIRDYGRYAGTDSVRYAQVALDGGSYRMIAYLGPTPSEYGPGNDPSPQWIPGTGQLVYVRYIDGGLRLYVGDSTGAARRVIASSSTFVNETDPDVSPDGAWIYFMGTTGGAQSLWRVPVIGGAPEQIATSTNPLGMASTALSPDGKRVAYVGRTYDYEMLQLYVRELSTGVTTMLTSNQAAGARWSPTGDWILYDVSYPYAGYSGVLRVVRPDRTGDRQVIDGKYYPGGTWTSDGKYLVAWRADPGFYGMELIDVAAGTRLPLVYGRSWYAPAWRR